MATKEIPIPAAEVLEDWNSRARSWYMTHYAVGVFAIILTLLVASKPGGLKNHGDAIEYLAFAAAVLQGLNTFLNSSRKAKGYRAAWRHLRAAVADYEMNPHVPESSLTQAIQKGWTLIVDIDEPTRS
jgi:hypothetical protein